MVHKPSVSALKIVADTSINIVLLLKKNGFHNLSYKTYKKVDSIHPERFRGCVLYSHIEALQARHRGAFRRVGLSKYLKHVKLIRRKRNRIRERGGTQAGMSEYSLVVTEC